MKTKRFLTLFMALLLLSCFLIVGCDTEPPAAQEPEEKEDEESVVTCSHVHKEIEETKPSAQCQPHITRTVCTDCGELIEELKKPSATKCQTAWKVVKRATGNEDGLEECRCIYCNNLTDSRILPKGYDSNGRLLDGLPSDLNHGGEQITVLYWSDVECPEFEQETVTGDNVRDAIYDRNNQIEDRLNVTIKWVGVPGDGGERKNFVAHVDSIYRADTQDYDIIASYSRTQGTLAVLGYLQDLSKINESYIDLEKPWWAKNIKEAASFGDSYYFLTGDISTNFNYMMHVVYLNKDLFSQYQLELPYQLVRNGGWTIDQMITLSTGRYKNADNVAGQSTGDYFGFQSMDYVATSLYIGAGLRYIERDATNMLKVSSDFTSDAAETLINKLGAWAATDDVWIHNATLDPNGIAGRPDYQNATKNGRVLMSVQHMVVARSQYSNADWSVGIVPLPKSSAAQQSYYTAMGNPYSLYGIFADFDTRGNKQETLTMLSAVLECWASEGYRLTNPEIFEVCLQLKYSKGQDETDMYILACENVRLDKGQIFASDLNNMVELPGRAFTSNTDWEENCEGYKSTVSEKLATVVENYRVYKELREQGK